MPARRTNFYLDTQTSKWLGVCSGIADYTGFDVTLVRVATIILTLSTTAGFLLAYLLVAWLAPVKPLGLYDSADDQRFWQGVRQSPARTARDVRSKFRDIDRRLADVETYYTTRNSSLASEIDNLK